MKSDPERDTTADAEAPVLSLNATQLTRLGRELRTIDPVAAASVVGILQFDVRWGDHWSEADTVRNDVIERVLALPDLKYSVLLDLCGTFLDDHDELLGHLAEAAAREGHHEDVRQEYYDLVPWSGITQPAAVALLRYAAEGFAADRDVALTVYWVEQVAAVAYPDVVERIEWFCREFCNHGDVWLEPDRRYALAETVLGWLPAPASDVGSIRRVVAAFDTCTWRGVLHEDDVDERLAELRHAVGGT